MKQAYKVPLVLSPQPEGGYTVTSPILPELITEGDTIDEVMQNVPDALAATIELYLDMNRPLPTNLVQETDSHPIWFEYLVLSA